MSGFFGGLWDGLQGGVLRKPIKKATGMTDAQMLGAAALAVGAPYALPSFGASGATAGTVGAANPPGLLNTAPVSLGQSMEPMTNFAAVDTPHASAASGAVSADANSAGLFEKYGGQASSALQGVSTLKGLLDVQEPPIQHAPLNRQEPNFAGLLSPQVDFDQFHRQRYQQYVQNIANGSVRN